MFRSPAFARADIAESRPIGLPRLDVAFFGAWLRLSARIVAIFAASAIALLRVNM